MIKRSQLKKAIAKNNTTDIAKELRICPRSRFFFNVEDANAFVYKMLKAGYKYAIMESWVCELDDATPDEVQEAKMAVEDKIDSYNASEYPMPRRAEEIVREFAGKAMDVWTATVIAPEAVQASINEEPLPMVICKDFGEPYPAQYLFVEGGEAVPHHGAYGFYFKNSDGELEEYGENDFVKKGTTVYLENGESALIEDYDLEDAAYYDVNGEEVMLNNGYTDVTTEWQNEYGVTSLLDLHFLGRIENTCTSYTAYYRAKDAKENTPNVLFARERSAWIKEDNEYFVEPITDEDEITSILKALEDI